MWYWSRWSRAPCWPSCTRGQIAWRTELDAPSRMRAALGADGVAYLSLTDSRVVAVSVSDGRVIWTEQLDGILSEPAAARQRVFVGSTNKVFYALDASSGRRAWYWPTGGTVLGSTADDKSVYVVSLDNIVRAFDQGSGNMRWQKPTSIRVVSPPRLAGGILIITGIRPILASFDPGTGTPGNTFVLPAELEFAVHDSAPLISLAAEPDVVSIVLVMRDGRVLGLRPKATTPTPKP